MLREAANTAGTKLDTAVVAGAVGLGALDIFVKDHGATFMFLGGGLLLTIRIGIAGMDFLRRWKTRNDKE